MKKLLLIFSLYLIPNTFACMPFSPSEILIGNYAGMENRVHPDKNFAEGRKIQFIKIDNAEKVFLSSNENVGKYYFLHSDNNDVDFSMKNYKIGDKIIIVADYNDGNLMDYFAVYEIGKLVKNNGKLDIIDMQGGIKDWGKTMWQCGNYRPDNVMDKEELLEKLNLMNLGNLDKIDSKSNLNYFYILALIIFVIGISIFKINYKKQNKPGLE